MVKKLDFYDFVRDQGEEYGIDPADIYQAVERVEVLYFERDRNNNIVAYQGGRKIVPDRQSGYIISENQLWICSLTSGPGLGISYAKPLKEIDAPFLYSLLPEHIDRMVDKIWEKNKATLEPQLDQKYQDQIEETISRRVEEEKAALHQQMESMQETIDSLERTEAEDKSIIESLQTRLEERESIVSAPVAPGEEPHSLSPLSMKLIDLRVRRTGPDVIESEHFIHPRYFVHASADTRILVVRPHESGTVICVDGKIRLQGLNFIMPFTQEQDMVADYSSQYGGIRILLR